MLQAACGKCKCSSLFSSFFVIYLSVKQGIPGARLQCRDSVLPLVGRACETVPEHLLRVFGLLSES